MAFLRVLSPLREKLAHSDAKDTATLPARDVLIQNIPTSLPSQTSDLEITSAPETDSLKLAPMLAPRDKIGVVLALLALYFIWGSTFVAIRFALGSFPPYLMAATRFIAAGIPLYILLRLSGRARPTWRQWRNLALLAALMLAGSNGLVAFAEQQGVASGIAAVGVAAVPLWVTLFMGLMGRWPTRIELIGLGLGFVGVILLNLEHGFWATPSGAIALLISPIFWAAGSALTLRLDLPEGLMASAGQMMLGGIIQLGIGLASGERMQRWPTPPAWWAIIYLIVAGSFVGYTCFGYVIKRVRPALATSYAYVNPVVALVLGILLLGEQITIIGFLSMTVILVGVGLVSLRKKTRH